MTHFPKIDSGRLWSDLMTMGAIGATDGGGSYRPALGDADREARGLFRFWAEEAGPLGDDRCHRQHFRPA